MSSSRALLWKDWRQLRPLRWTGIALGALLPLGLAAVAGATRRGVPLLGWDRSPSAAELYQEVIPLLLGLGLLPLWALLAAIQSFCGDRQGGTESFLLERPVPRGRVWRSRLATAASATLLQALCSIAAWYLIAYLLAGLAPRSLHQGLVEALAWGSITVPAAFGAGVLVASFGLPSVLALLAGGGVCLGSLMVGWFVDSWYYDGFVFTYGDLCTRIVSILSLVVFLLVSFLMLCRGEPAGRRRIRRGLVSLASAAATTIIVFVSFTVAIDWARARWVPDPFWGLEVYAPPAGSTTLLVNGEAGWLVDLESGDRIAYLPPPLGAYHTTWSPDGRYLAIFTRSSPLGRWLSQPRIEILDARGGQACPPYRLVGDEWPRSLEWAGDRLLVALQVGESRHWRIVSLTPGEEAQPTTLTELESGDLYLAGPSSDGAVLLARELEDEVDRDWGCDSPLQEVPYDEACGLGLFRLDPVTGEKSQRPVLRGRWHWRYGLLGDERLSPSGRLWLPSPFWDAEALEVRDLMTGEDVLVPIEGNLHLWFWMAGDRLVWREGDEDSKRLYLWEPGRERRLLAEGVGVGYLPSPDGRLLWVRVHDPSPTDAHPAAGMTYRYYDVTAETWTELSGADRPEGHSWAGWAGPRHLVLEGTDSLLLRSLDAPEGPGSLMALW